MAIDQNTFSRNRFILILPRCPIFSHYAQQVTIPAQSINTATLPTRVSDIPVPGEKIQFGEMTVTANLDQYWLAYEEVNNWKRGIATPYHGSGFGDMQTHFGSEGVPSEILTSIPDLTKMDTAALNAYSNGVIILKNGNNVSIAQLNIENILPISMDTGDLETTVTEGNEPIAFSTNFAVGYTEFERLRLPWES